MHTRLPHAQVLLDYLKIYLKMRIPDWESLQGTVKTRFEQALSYITHRDPVVMQIRAIINDVNSEIETAQDFTAWYKLIFILRGKAEIARSFKSNFKSDESLLRKTLHALAGFVIFELTEHSKEFHEKINSLNKRKSKYERDILHCLKNRRGKGVKETNLNINKILLELAYLGEEASINAAYQHHLLNDFKLPDASEFQKYTCADEGNFAAPLYLQPKFFLWLYQSKYQPMTKISFGEFVKEATVRAEEEKLKKDNEIAKQAITVSIDNKKEPCAHLPSPYLLNEEYGERKEPVDVHQQEAELRRDERDEGQEKPSHSSLITAEPHRVGMFRSKSMMIGLQEHMLSQAEFESSQNISNSR